MKSAGEGEIRRLIDRKRLAHTWEQIKQSLDHERKVSTMAEIEKEKLQKSLHRRGIEPPQNDFVVSECLTDCAAEATE